MFNDIDPELLEWVDQKKSEILSYIIEIDEGDDLPFEHHHEIEFNRDEKKLPLYLLESFNHQSSLIAVSTEGLFKGREITILRVFLQVDQGVEIEVIHFPSYSKTKIDLLISKISAQGKKIN